jgi:hypothetical protein
MTGLLDAAKEVQQSGAFGFLERSTTTAELLQVMGVR